MPDPFKIMSIQKESYANMKNVEDDMTLSMRHIMQGLQNTKAARGQDISSLQAFVFRGSELDDIDSLNARMRSEIKVDQLPAIPALATTASYCVRCRLAATMRCAGCHVTRYCSKLCQRKHWPVHKETCASVALR